MSYAANPYGRARSASFGGRWSRLGALGASSPTMVNQDPTGAGAAAYAAVAAVASASAAQLRSAIPAVRAFQQAYGHGLTVDGRYGPNTRAALVTVTGRTDLPAAGSSSGSSASYAAPTPVDPSAPVDPSVVSASSTPSWLVPVAVVSVLVLAAGGVLYTQRKPVRANGRRKKR